jgi:glycosyltransferase involved in cell wall biosynthesis
VDRTTTIILGRFPPPIDGQTVATAQLAHLLEPTLPITRVDVSPQEDHVLPDVRFRPQRVAHYLRRARGLAGSLKDRPQATILWTNISPSCLGHYRDWLTTVGAFNSDQRVFAVVHHGDFHRLFEQRGTRHLSRLLIKRLEGVVFLTERLAQRCAAWIPASKRHVIPNSIGEDRIPTDDEVVRKQQDHTDDRELRLLFVSNMIPSKGFADLVDAAHLLKAKGTSLHVRMVGRWPSEAAAHAFRADLHAKELDDVVRHFGTIPDAERMKALYLWADAVVLPTYYPTEAQPLVLLEALSAGTPVITTRHGGIPEIISEGVEGSFVPHRSPAAIAEAALSLLQREVWIERSQAARRRFLDSYSPQAVRRQWLHLVRPSVATD